MEPENLANNATRMLWSKRQQGFQSVSSWYGRTLYRSCNSELRSPRFTLELTFLRQLIVNGDESSGDLLLPLLVHLVVNVFQDGHRVPVGLLHLHQQKVCA